jgi:heparosan-N-sulfate-glucuronate 5-epimerase
MPLSVLPDATATPKRAPVLHERVLGGARAAIGRGRGYESQPVGQRFTDAPLNGYFIDFRAKTTSRTAATPTGLSPAALAQLALGWWERAIAGEASALPRFLETAELLRRTAQSTPKGSLWAYDADLPKYGVRAPWHSAMAQGQIASVFARVAESTGDAADAELAIAAIQPLLRPTQLSLVALTSEGPVLEEAPSDPPSRILNGWIYALVGLHEVGEGLHDEAAAKAFREGIVALERSLPLYDVGWWSRYSLFPHRFVDLAKPFYHRLHVAQLDALHRLTGVDDFVKASVRWAAYDRLLPRSRALAQKAVFRAFRGEPE